jgi:5-methylcytosine-specific restriction enzyme subunit McrC
MYCLETESEQGGLFQTKPDILVKRGRQVVQVIDTKWKRIVTRIDDKKQGVSQADVYQMMAYGRLYNCPCLTLLYPHHADLLCEEGVQASHRVVGSDHCLKTATVDVAIADGIGQRLRSLIKTMP